MKNEHGNLTAQDLFIAELEQPFEVNEEDMTLVAIACTCTCGLPSAETAEATVDRE